MQDEIKQLLDYVTNLQEENENLKKQLNCKEIYSNYMPKDTEFIIMSKADYERQELDYKSRIDKAIEYIWSTKYEYGDLEEDNEDFDIDVYELLNILNGGDE